MLYVVSLLHIYLRIGSLYFLITSHFIPSPCHSSLANAYQFSLSVSFSQVPFLHNSVRESCIFLGIYLFLLSCPFFLWCINCSESSLMILCISVVSVVTSCLSLLIFLFEFSFFLLSLAEFYELVYAFKKQLFVSLIFLVVLLISISFVSVLIFLSSFY